VFSCHPEPKPFVFCHSEERSDEESREGERGGMTGRGTKQCGWIRGRIASIIEVFLSLDRRRVR